MRAAVRKITVFAIRTFPFGPEVRARIILLTPWFFNFLDQLVFDGSYSSEKKIGAIKGSNSMERAVLSRRKKNLDPFEIEETLYTIARDKLKSAPTSTQDHHVAYIVHNCLPYAFGGYASRTDEIVKCLQAKGIKVTVFARPNFPWDSGHPLASQANHTRRTGGATYVFTRLARSSGASSYVYTSAVQLSRRFKGRGITHVLAASNQRVGLIGLIAAKLSGKPFLYDVRGFWEVTRLSREPEYELSAHFKRTVALETLVANNAERVWAITPAARDLMVSRGVEKASIRLLRNGAPIAKSIQKISTSKLLRLGYIGSIVHYEGLDLLLKALSKSKAKFHLDIVGNDSANIDAGPLLTELQELALQLGIAEHVHFHGAVPKFEVSKYYESFDICLFPRRSLPVTEVISPLKPFEALSHGKLVCCSEVGGMSGIVKHGVTGYTFKPDDVESIRQLLDLLSATPPQALNKIREAGLKAVKRMTWSQRVDSLASYIRGEN